MKEKESRIDEEEITTLRQHARHIRELILLMIVRAGSGHPASALGLADIVTALYYKIMHYNPEDPEDPDRDLFVLSNGHVCPVIYATMAELKMIPAPELLTLRKLGSRLQGHPERLLLPGIETTSGPLGEGLSQAAGMAYSLKYLDKDNQRHVYCLVGDGELDEGENWEAAAFAAKYGLDNLTVIVDYNRIQLSGKTKDIMPMAHLTGLWRNFGWNVYQLLDGNNMREVVDVLGQASQPVTEESHDFKPGAPNVVIAHTTPGYGVSFMENDYHWHGKAPTIAQAKAGIKELEAMHV